MIRPVAWLGFGIALGLGAGIAPSPLLGLVLANSLRRGFGSGLLTSLSPLFTDLLIIGTSLTLLQVMPARMVATLGIIGGIVIIGLAVDSLVVARRRDPVPRTAAMRRVVSESAFANLFNPHPWLFWLTAGGALLSTAYDHSPGRAVWFLAGFYVALVGVKVVCARIVSTSGRPFSPEPYRRALVASAVLLTVSGVLVVIHFFPTLLDLGSTSA
jgi:threonine/homoserine/homoserine lactone efflux protein